MGDALQNLLSVLDDEDDRQGIPPAIDEEDVTFVSAVDDATWLASSSTDETPTVFHSDTSVLKSAAVAKPSVTNSVTVGNDESLSADEIRRKLDELERMKVDLLKKLDKKSKTVQSTPLEARRYLVPIDFGNVSAIQKPKPAGKSVVHSGDTSSSEDERERHNDNEDSFFSIGGPSLTSTGCMIKDHIDKWKTEMLTTSLGSSSSSSVRKNQAPVSATSVNSESSVPAKKIEEQFENEKPCETNAKVTSSDVFDGKFGIRIRNPKISSAAFAAYSEEMRKVRLSHLKPSALPTGEWLTMGVVVGKSEFKRSVNNREYMIWNLSDLLNCQDPPIKALLFGDCVKEHWKLPVGTVVSLSSPTFADDSAGPVTLKLTKQGQVLNMGTCPDFGYCKGRRKDGTACRNFVNLSQTNSCVYHIQSAVRQLSARRGTFGSTTSNPPRSWQAKVMKGFPSYSGTMVGPRRTGFGAPKPALKLLQISDVRKGQKRTNVGVAGAKDSKEQTAKKEGEELKNILRKQASTFGAKNLLAHQESQKGLKSDKQDHSGSFNGPKSLKDFIMKQKNEMLVTAGPRLGRGIVGDDVSLISPPKKTTLVKSPQKKTPTQAAADLAKKKAIEVVRARGGILKNYASTACGPGSSRKRNSESSHRTSQKSTESCSSAEVEVVSAKRAKFSDEELRALLNKRSTHEGEVLKEDAERQAAYFNAMEQKEKVETFVTSIMEVKDCSVVSCKKCNYTAPRQSDFCMINGHLVKRHKADKRFFRCRSCRRRLTCYELMPTKPCDNCHGMEFDRVAMRDERKTKQYEEKLLVRGEERKFVNS